MALTIPGDQLHRCWVQANLEEDFRRKLSSGIVVFIGFGPGQESKLAGTGFVIGSTGSFALVITAKHVLTDGIGRIQRPYRRSHPSTLNEFSIESADHPQVDPQKLRAVWMGESEADMCLVHSVEYNDVLDIATCLISRQNQQPTESKFHSSILDTSTPEVGSRIALISSSNLSVSDVSISQDLKHHMFSVSKNIVVRMGIVTSVHPTGLRQHQFPLFETSIPVEEGMSGGLVYFPIEDEPIAACGVVCADFSEADAFSNFQVCGNSLMSMIWPAVGLSIPATFPIQDDSPRKRILDFINSGDIQNLARDGVALRIESFDDGNYRVHRCI